MSNSVEGVMNYLADTAEKPVTYMYTPPAGTPPRTGHYAKFPVSVSVVPGFRVAACGLAGNDGVPYAAGTSRGFCL